jgi:beta-lactamase regulating signal transducer with metallopeptidase domain
VLSVLLLIVLSLILFISLKVLIKILRINHPKNKFWIYLIAFLSVFSIFLCSIFGVGYSTFERNKIENSNISSTVDNCSLILIIEDSQIDTTRSISMNKYFSELNCGSINKNSESSPYRVLSFLTCFSGDPKIILSQLISSSQDSSKGPRNPITFSNNNQMISKDNENIIQDNINKFESGYPLLFLIFNFFLILMSLLYLAYSFIFGKNIILKNFKAEECQNVYVTRIVDKLCKEIKIRTPKIYIFNGCPNAFVFGYPVSLVISRELINCLSKEELCIALRHELAHIKNRDYILKPLLQTVRILFFYNPVIHLLYYKIINERELLADSQFIKSKDEKIMFMNVLFKIYDSNKNLFYKNIPISCGLSLLSDDFKKLKTIDRYNHLFNKNIKKTLYTTLICLIIIFSNFSVFVLAQNNNINNSDKINDYVEMDKIELESIDHLDHHKIDHIYIIRIFKENPHIAEGYVLKNVY